MSGALPSYMYRNPEEVLERKQEYEFRKSCTGCVHAYEVMFGSLLAKACNKGKRYGKRCNLYREKK